MGKNELWDSLRSKSKYIETDMDLLRRKRTGSYYTDLELTDVMMAELISYVKKGNKNIIEYRFFEPCVGAGNFVFSYLKEVKKNWNLSAEKAKILLENVYVADVNEKALQGYKESLKIIAQEYWGIKLEDEYFKSHLGTGLLVDVTACELTYIPLEKVFPDVEMNSFDIVVTNPPYKNLKAERGHYGSDEEYEIDRKKYSSIVKIVSKRFKYSKDGVLNLYKLFVEEIIDRYASNNGYVSLLIPASIMSDKTCQKLRTHILKDSNLLSVKIIGEGSKYIDAQQALSAILIKKGEKTTCVKVTKDFCHDSCEETDIRIEDIMNENTGNSIIAISKKEYWVLKKLRKFPVVKELDFIINLRGELDLTTNKKNITSLDTGYPLLRGRNIGYYSLIDTGENEFVLQEFVKTSKKHCYIQKERIVCQQIANIHKERRVTFSLVPANYVLGNSCNFISVLDNPYHIDIYAILGLFNTKIINWLFKLTSSNNHINNYEIDCFPVPIGSPLLPQISDKSKEYLETRNIAILLEIEKLAALAYGIINNEFGAEQMLKKEIILKYYEDIRHVLPEISQSDASKILSGEIKVSQLYDKEDKFTVKVINGITDKYLSLYHGYILNQTTFKLSDLDLEMIKSVPQGGSWKDIPMETVKKSKRLERITQTGGRTTLYGRIDYAKPSYTITTYFNRPGNGTYVHPVHERVVSVREAARFQTFQDDYYFFGNKMQLLKQVGNAVPTLLAYQIGKCIVEKTECSKSIDLFCGAGGMTVGFKAAGISSLLSNDIEESACTTLKINNPEIPVLCGDITQENIKATIEKVAKEGGADIICGGPPCQGFSMAGYRSETDPRNQLFREFVDIVKRVNPKIIVFENVEGLLSYQGGKTYREVHALFSELGYNTEGRLLKANDYAVPQKRKRVIIICTKNDLGISPGNLYPNEITTDADSQVTARETIADLETVMCSETAKYVEGEEGDILKFFKGKITYEEYVEGRTSKKRPEFSCGEIYVDSNGQLSFYV